MQGKTVISQVLGSNSITGRKTNRFLRSPTQGYSIARFRTSTKRFRNSILFYLSFFCRNNKKLRISRGKRRSLAKWHGFLKIFMTQLRRAILSIPRFDWPTESAIVKDGEKNNQLRYIVNTIEVGVDKLLTPAFADKVKLYHIHVYKKMINGNKKAYGNLRSEIYFKNF